MASASAFTTPSGGPAMMVYRFDNASDSNANGPAQWKRRVGKKKQPNPEQPREISDASNIAKVAPPATAQGPKWYNNAAWKRPAPVEVVNLLSDDSTSEDGSESDSEDEPENNNKSESDDSTESDESEQPGNPDPSDESEDSGDSEDSDESIDSDDDTGDVSEPDQLDKMLATIPGLSKKERILTAQRIREGVNSSFSGPPAIWMATPDRRYNTFEGLAKHGGIFPEGYKKWTNPNYPWICPIRSCRNIFHNRAGIGGHMNGKHVGDLLNDNGDGTLSIIGMDQTPDGERSRRRPVVVSKKPLDPNEPPMAVPSVPQWRRSKASYVPPPQLPLKALGKPTTKPSNDTVALQSKGKILPAANQSDATKMWNYIRPFLIRNKTEPPKLGWVPELISLRRVRDLAWNTEWTETNPYVDSTGKDVSAMIVYLTGERAPTACTRCETGRGPFKGCIMISKAAPENARNAITSCANCLYHQGQTWCSHNPASRARISGIGPAAASSPAASGTSSTPDISNLALIRSDITPASTPAHLTPAQRSLPRPVLKPSEVKVIEMANSDRPYKMLLDISGKHTSSSGTLIPAGYVLDYTIPNHPWICPVRDCRLVFKGHMQLGCHFVRRHRAKLFNDNDDGTLTTVASYNTPLPGKGNTLCAFVISKGKPARNEPLAEPSVPGTVKQDETPAMPKHSYRAGPQGITPAGFPDWLKYDTAEEVDKATEMWRYVQSQLPNAKDIPRERRIKALLTLPRVRDVRWKPGFPKRTTPEDPNHIIGLLTYVTGDSVDPDKPCELCQRGGALASCVIVSRNAPEHVWKNFSSCANCYYGRSQYNCTAREVYKKRFLATTSTGPVKNIAANKPEADRPLRKRRRVDSGEEIRGRSSPEVKRRNFTWDKELAWESAPGRVQATDEEAVENIAFSKLYLSRNDPVQVDNGVAFRIHTVRPDRELKFDIDHNNTRICSVAVGLFYVSVGDVGFTISAHGIFKVEAGTECEVYNLSESQEAILHVTLLSKDHY